LPLAASIVSNPASCVSIRRRVTWSARPLSRNRPPQRYISNGSLVPIGAVEGWSRSTGAPGVSKFHSASATRPGLKA
jgi:hypothetical protein